MHATMYIPLTLYIRFHKCPEHHYLPLKDLNTGTATKELGIASGAPQTVRGIANQAQNSTKPTDQHEPTMPLSTSSLAIPVC